MAAPEIADLDPDEGDIVAVVHDWVHDSVLPVARDLEHADTYPAELIQTMKELGVYGLVRHPIYLGYALQIGGQALWLGSTAAALIGVGVYLAATLGRIRIEERDLVARLPAYAAYARRVRGRLIPFVL